MFVNTITSLARKTLPTTLRRVPHQVKEIGLTGLALKSIDKRLFSEGQKRMYSTQTEGSAGRDKIYTGPFGTTITGTQVVFGGGGVLFLLLATFFGWAYCESRSDGELCESIRSKLGVNKKTNNIPEAASHCIERKEALERIKTLFSSLKGDHPIVAIVGDPASGKTELCKQYAQKHKEDYHHIWFVQIENWQKEYQNMALNRKLFSDKEIKTAGGISEINIDLIISKVHNSFSHAGRKKSLIIFENAPEGFIVDKLKGQLPKQTDILVTSRSTHWESTLNLSTECRLTLEEGLHILRKWIGDERFDPIEAEKIVRRFAYSPVPIAQAGSYLFKTKEPINEYLPLFERNKQETLKQGTLSGNIDIVVSLKIAINEVKKVEPEAEKLLYCCALLPAKNIPKDLLVKLFNSDRNKLNRCLLLLDSLLLRDPEKVSIHDLFQEIIEEEAKTQEKHLLLELGKACDGFEDFLMINPKKAIPILKGRLEGDKTVISNKEKARKIQYLLGSCYLKLDDIEKSLHYFECFLRGASSGLSKDESSMCIRYDKIAMDLYGKELYEEALKFFQKALEIRKKVLGEGHSDTALSYNNTAGDLRRLRRYEEALKHDQKALEIRKKVLGEGHSDTAISYNHTADDLRSLGRYEEALKHVQKALEICKKVLGEGNSDTA